MIFRKERFTADDIRLISDAQMKKECKRNLDGIEAEKSGDIKKAIKLYEQNVKDKSITPHPYKRLAIIYRKEKLYQDEARVLRVAIKELAPGADWFQDRLNKMIEKGLI